ncbi:hypothetical protein H2200_011439 [Cladophialophora chaetospira]|uniref:Uncharacterized protein n=1 Tax=Cladophialophora chaetospira TaxID=386627 RepID=A0AA38WZE7_9EURO|nr:hypothetical protein H2200_011439 [Cladophialophora chaetospira]
MRDPQTPPNTTPEKGERGAAGDSMLNGVHDATTPPPSSPLSPGDVEMQQDDVSSADAISGISIKFYFGLNSDRRDQVSEDEFQGFVDTVISPLFECLSIMKLSGHWVSASNGSIVKEPSRCVEILSEDTQEVHAKCGLIAAKYKEHFMQDSVLRVVTQCNYYFH